MWLAAIDVVAIIMLRILRSEFSSIRYISNFHYGFDN